MGNDMEIRGTHPAMPGAYTARGHRSGATGAFGAALHNAAERSGHAEPEGSEAESAEKTETTEDGEKDYRKQLQEKMAEMLENIRKGTIQPKFRIGAQEYTHEEWNKLIEKIDAAEEDLREQLAARIEALKEEAQERADAKAAEKEKPENI